MDKLQGVSSSTGLAALTNQVQSCERRLLALAQRLAALWVGKLGYGGLPSNHHQTRLEDMVRRLQAVEDREVKDSG